MLLNGHQLEYHQKKMKLFDLSLALIKSNLAHVRVSKKFNDPLFVQNFSSLYNNASLTLKLVKLVK